MLPDSVLDLLLLLTALAGPATADPAFRPFRPSRPDPPSNFPDVPARPGPGAVPGVPTAPNVLPDPVVVQANMGRLEQRLELAAKGLDFAKEIAEAILSTPKMPTRIGDLASMTVASDVTFTPTASLPISSFAACTSYAQSLEACASKSSDFYSLPLTSQASCACYTAGSAQTVACTASGSPTSYLQMASIPTLSPASFDDNANMCWHFLSEQGYINVADILLDPEELPGAQFCANVDASLKGGNGTNRANGTSAGGLEQTLEATLSGGYPTCFMPPTLGGSEVTGGTTKPVPFRASGQNASFVFMFIVASLHSLSLLRVI
ncbi:hypothetical protein BDV95DRAFT_45751 [Massariosphaeria phaeospora]|uniref:Extracellular membrane protein CFEM domain-containing protein n=1 Tax=Massariosphaeria phaeospora TaxID=100035 RepID=A0A7C8I5Y4_9PLEO|nr:hypothetical protein BDV95DRAFT_45751 [Massariosphaeria phaeospora]